MNPHARKKPLRGFQYIFFYILFKLIYVVGFIIGYFQARKFRKELFSDLDSFEITREARE